MSKEKLSPEEATKAELFIETHYPTSQKNVNDLLNSMQGLVGTCSKDVVIEFWTHEIKLSANAGFLNPDSYMAVQNMVSAVRKFEQLNQMERSIGTSDFLKLLARTELNAIKLYLDNNQIVNAGVQAGGLSELLNFYGSIH